MEIQNITATIGIDYAHRGPLHQSKCRHTHGHRGTITAEMSGDLFKEGPQSGMVLDFGFLKELMMKHIDAYCDHGIILAADDHKMLALAFNDIVIKQLKIYSAFPTYSTWIDDIKLRIEDQSFWAGETAFGKTYIIEGAPTAENLARHWFQILDEPTRRAADGHAELTAIIVGETPTNIASYRRSL